MRSSGGRPFQVEGPPTEKARICLVEVRAKGTRRKCIIASGVWTPLHASARQFLEILSEQNVSEFYEIFAVTSSHYNWSSESKTYSHVAAGNSYFCFRNRNLGISKALLKSQAHQ